MGTYELHPRHPVFSMEPPLCCSRCGNKILPLADVEIQEVAVKLEDGSAGKAFRILHRFCAALEEQEEKEGV